MGMHLRLLAVLALLTNAFLISGARSSLLGPGIIPEPAPGLPLHYYGPQAQIDPNFVTSSGFSSGAFMNMQLHFCYSHVIKAVGMFAGGPYAQDYGAGTFPSAAIAGGLTWGLLAVYPDPTPVSELVTRAETFEAAGHTDPLSNINGSKVFVHQGVLDPLVQYREGNRTTAMYEAFGADVKYVVLTDATHTVPTDNYGSLCPVFDALHDGVNNCEYEGVFHMFSHIYPGFIRPASSTAPQATGSHYYLFDQTPFVPSAYTSSRAFMAQNGWLYIPPGCQNSSVTCRLHVALHGCWQSIYDNYNLLANLYATKTGYTQVADTNNIVMVFPQAAPTYVNLNQSNIACWDYFGGTTPDFAFKTAPQMETIYNIIASLTGLPPIP